MLDSPRLIVKSVGLLYITKGDCFRAQVRTCAAAQFFSVAVGGISKGMEYLCYVICDALNKIIENTLCFTLYIKPLNKNKTAGDTALIRLLEITYKYEYI